MCVWCVCMCVVCVHVCVHVCVCVVCVLGHALRSYEEYVQVTTQ